MSRRHLPYACAFALSCLAPAVVADDRSKAPAPSFGAGVELVTVDVVVASKDGAPVVGLSKDDFQISEDGQPQAITSFEAVELPAATNAVPAPAPAVSSNATVETRTARSFAVLFDDVHLPAAQSQRAREVVSEFLKRNVRESDRVLLATTSGRVWWSARMEAGRADLLALLETLQGQRVLEGSARERMSDYEALRIIEHQDRDVCERVRRRFITDSALPEDAPGLYKPQLLTSCDPIVDARAREIYYPEVDRIRATMAALERIMNGMAAARGRKTVILVSTGFVFDQEQSDARRVVAASRRSNAAVYFVDVRGLGAGNESLFQAHYENPDKWGTTDVVQGSTSTQLTEELQEAEGAVGVAADTGGFSVRNTNDLASGMGRIADESRAYYLLGYTPKNAVRDGKFRKLTVEVSRKDVKVRARRGYFATVEPMPSTPAGAMPPEMRRAADAPFEVDGIGLRTTALVFERRPSGQARVELVADIALAKVAFEQLDGRQVGAIDALLTVTRREGGKPQSFSETINLKLRPGTGALAQYYPYRKPLELEAGHYQARLVVRDHRAGAVGSVVHDFAVPALEGFRVATPVLTDVAPPNAQGQPQPMPVARREFPSAGTLVCLVEAYGAALDSASRQPRVLLGYSLRRGSQEITANPPEAMAAGPDGKVGGMFGWQLGSLAPGSYDLALKLADQVGGESQELHEAFTVVAAPTAQ